MDSTKLIIALDYDSAEACLTLVRQLDPKSCRLKIGKELFTAAGPSIVEAVQHQGFEVFLDLKFHDIPNTVAKAVKAAANMGVWMVNVHASGGQAMMEAALEQAQAAVKPPYLIAVTVLTSIDQPILNSVGISGSPAQQVERLALLAKMSGLNGVVCSAHEVHQIKAACGPEFLCVTPGIRPQGSNQDDQKRIMTPQQAIQNGSDYLVVGRPVTQAKDPAAVCIDINNAIDQAQATRGKQ